jgi:hypothetical protein
MSLAASRNVWRMTLAPAEKLVLLNLADRANVACVCWPSQKTMARDTGLSERSVRAKLRQLENCGLISRMPRMRGSSRISDLIRLKLTAQPDAEPVAAALRQDLPVGPGTACRQTYQDEPIRLNQDTNEPCWFERMPEPGRPETFDHNAGVRLARSVSRVIERADWRSEGLVSLARLVDWVGRYEYDRLERCLIETARRANRAGSTIKSWKYFAHAVSQLEPKRH